MTHLWMLVVALLWTHTAQAGQAIPTPTGTTWASCTLTPTGPWWSQC